MSRATIRDVALAAGVSVSTVSKVLNGRYGVSEATQQKIAGIIADMGFESSLVARSLRNHRTNVVGILVSDLEPFSAELLKGAAQGIRDSGYELVVYSAGGRTGDNIGWERRSLSRLGGTLIDGAVLVTPTIVDAFPGVPCVAVDPHTGVPGVPTVSSDNIRGARLATEYALSLGHRRIGFIQGRTDLESAQLREKGYREALKAAKVRIDPKLVRHGEFTFGPARVAAGELLDLDSPPKAIFAANDAMALAVLDVARERGISVPDELSVIGFDNVPESVLCTPPLTTVHQPIQQMGRRAVEMLMSLLRGEEVEPTRLVLETELVVRGSTAPPKG